MAGAERVARRVRLRVCFWRGRVMKRTRQVAKTRGIAFVNARVASLRSMFRTQPEHARAVWSCHGRTPSCTPCSGRTRSVRRCLRPGGKALIQTITIDERLFERYRAGSDFIQQMVFPGGMLPSVERFERVAAVHGLAMTDIHRFGRDYAETLRRWRSAFDQHRAALPALGLDEAFARTWQLYLCYCEAAFLERAIGVCQVMWAKPGCVLGNVGNTCS